MGIGRLVARTVIGGLFIGHGTQKLFGWFDGPGIEGTTPMMGSLGMHPAKHNAYAAGLSEAVGGSMLVLGAATPLAAAAITGTMVTAIRKVHQANGPWAQKGGWEYCAVLIASVVALAEVGPGGFSVDSARGHVSTGAKPALLALLLGIGASTAAIELGKRNAPPVEATVAADADAGQKVGGNAGDPVETV